MSHASKDELKTYKESACNFSVDPLQIIRRRTCPSKKERIDVKRCLPSMQTRIGGSEPSASWTLKTMGGT